MFFESTWAFQSGLHHLKWQLQNKNSIHKEERSQLLKLFHKVRRKIAQINVQNSRFKMADI